MHESTGVSPCAHLQDGQVGALAAASLQRSAELAQPQRHVGAQLLQLCLRWERKHAFAAVARRGARVADDQAAARL